MKRNTKMKNKVNKLILDIADSVSNNELSADQYLRKNNVDINAIIKSGLKELKKHAKKSEPNELSKSQTFFRRAVLAAEIVNQCYNEWTFGSVKFQKLMYLCEQASKMNFATNYVKQAAGPFDHKFMHSFKTEFKNQKWFDTEKSNDKYGKVTFAPLNKVDSYKKYYEKYYSDVHDKIQYIIDTFFKSKTDDVELVATIYFSWDEILTEKNILSDKLIIKKVYKWHPQKKDKFTEDKIIQTIRWMNERGIYPQLA